MELNWRQVNLLAKLNFSKFSTEAVREYPLVCTLQLRLLAAKTGTVITDFRHVLTYT